MRAIVTAIGRDRAGILAAVGELLRVHNVNVLDISQTVMREYFTMIMLVSVTEAALPFAELAAAMAQAGDEMGIQIRIQREDLFNAMHRI